MSYRAEGATLSQWYQKVEILVAFSLECFDKYHGQRLQPFLLNLDLY
jgi:hypothetical protein